MWRDDCFKRLKGLMNECAIFWVQDPTKINQSGHGASPIKDCVSPIETVRDATRGMSQKVMQLGQRPVCYEPPLSR